MDLPPSVIKANQSQIGLGALFFALATGQLPV